MPPPHTPPPPPWRPAESQPVGCTNHNINRSFSSRVSARFEGENFLPGCGNNSSFKCLFVIKDLITHNECTRPGCILEYCQIKFLKDSSAIRNLRNSNTTSQRSLILRWFHSHDYKTRENMRSISYNCALELCARVWPQQPQHRPQECPRRVPLPVC